MITFKEYLNEISSPDLSRIPKLKTGLSALKTQIVDTPLDFNIITDLLAKSIKKIFRNTTFSKVKEGTAAIGFISIMMQYAQDDDDIEITFVTHPKTTKIHFSGNDFAKLVVEIIDAIEHELIHKAQASARDFEYQRDKEDKKSYYNRADEVDAYARDIAKEIKRNYKPGEHVPFDRPDVLKSNTLKVLLGDYKKKNITRNKQRLMKKVTQYYNT